MHISSEKDDGNDVLFTHIILPMPFGFHAIQFLGCDGFSFIIIIFILSFRSFFKRDDDYWNRVASAATGEEEEGGEELYMHSIVTGKKEERKTGIPYSIISWNRTLRLMLKQIE